MKKREVACGYPRRVVEWRSVVELPAPRQCGR